MSKLSFRARALDATKPLPIYHAEDLPDLSEYNTINRTVPQMPTGMEKEEESERHLQEAILSQQSNSKKNRVYIPTPEASISVPYFEDLYNRLVEAPPLQYIRVPGLGLEEEVPDYDLDSEDEEWLNAQTDEWPLSPTHFERMMDQLEKGSGNTVLSEREAQLFLKDDDDLVLAVYDYWLAKRLRLGRALIPTVKHERRDGSSSANPYMAFRKRTEKMQTRKNRKNDEAAYMQMLKLKRDLARACSLAELVREREDKKNDLSQVQMDIFKKRYLLEDWSGSVTASLHPVVTKSATSRQGSGVGEGGQWEGRTVLIKLENGEEDDIHRVGRHEVLVSSGMKRKRKKKYYYAATTPEPEPAVPTTPDKAVKDTSRDRIAERSDDEEPDGIFSFKRKLHIKYHSPHGSLGDWPWYGSVEEEEEEEDENVREGRKYRFSRTTLSGRFIGRSRRRVGRGGRVLWDRITLSDSEDEAPFTAQSQGVQPMEGGGDQESKDERSISEDKERKCLHFLSCPPSPSSNFQFQRLPLIELPAASNSSTSNSRVPPYGHPISSLGFGGFASDSEYSEEASSFATLPTSQFALKPSSDDMECEPSEQRKKISMSEKLELRFWHGTGDRSPSSVMDSTEGENVGNSNQVGTLSRRSRDDYTPSAPPSTSSFSSSSSPSFASAQHKQQMSHHTNAARHSNDNAQQVAPQKDMSRTSLSVMDSKTIILSNAPTSAVRHQIHSSTKQTQRQSAQNSASEAVSNKPLIPILSGGTGTVAVEKKEKLVGNGPKQALPLATPTQNCEGDACAMNGPATNVLQLNFPLKNIPENSKNSRMLATADTALLITSQFVKQSQQFVERKREEGSVGGIGSELSKLSNASRDLQPTSKVDSLLPQVVDKRTTSLPSSRRASTGTNGTSYQEIFHSTSRRLSETERGLKQALAGSMMNHSNLLETTASLVQLGNPSEVT